MTDVAAVRAQFDHYIVQRNEARKAENANLTSYLDGVLDGICLTLTYGYQDADLGLELQKAKTADTWAFYNYKP